MRLKKVECISQLTPRPPLEFQHARASATRRRPNHGWPAMHALHLPVRVRPAAVSDCHGAGSGRAQHCQSNCQRNGGRGCVSIAQKARAGGLWPGW